MEMKIGIGWRSKIIVDIRNSEKVYNQAAVLFLNRLSIEIKK
jgi:hypothetical protein